MADKEIIIYSTPTWPHCKRVKEYLSQKQVAYTEHDVAQDREAAQEMVKKTGQMGVPVIIVDGEIVVGFNQSKLDDLLAK